MVGGLAGAGIGNQSGRPPEGTAIGGALGVLTGSVLGANLDAYDGGAYSGGYHGGPAFGPYYGPRPAYYAPRTQVSIGYSNWGRGGRSRYHAGYHCSHDGYDPGWGYPGDSCW